MKNTFSLFSESFRIFRSNIKSYALIGVLPGIIAAVSTLFDPLVDGNGHMFWLTPTEQTMFWVFILVSILIGSIAQIATIYLASGHELTTRNALTAALKTLPRYIGLVFVTIVVVAVALLLLILPGIWAMVALSFSSFFLVLENESIKNSMKKSYALTKGKFWFVTLGNYIALGMVFFVMTLILNLVSELFMPTTAAYAISSGITAFLYTCSTIFLYTLFLHLNKLRSASAETTS